MSRCRDLRGIGILYEWLCIHQCGCDTISRCEYVLRSKHYSPILHS